MLEYHSEETSEVDYVYPHPEQNTETVNPTKTNEDIEDYLDRVNAPLVGVLPRSKREAIRGNLRARLESMIAAERELGASQDAAIQAAMQQCGDPTLISQRWAVDTHTQASKQIQQQISLLNHNMVTLPSSRVATLTALGLFGLPYLADVTRWAGNYWATQSDNAITYYRFFLFMVPLLAGLLTGLIARHRPVRGVLNALAILTIPAIVLPGLIMGLGYANVVFTQNTWVYNPLPGICGLVPWLVMGCLGAGVGKGLRERTAKLRTRLSRHIRLKRMERKRIQLSSTQPNQTISA